MAKLKDFMPKREGGDTATLEAYQGIPVTVTAVKFGQSQYGEIAFMDCITPSGEKVQIMTGAMLVMSALHNAVDAEALPLEATFNKPGRAWIIQ
jgi:hypothetical protein